MKDEDKKEFKEADKKFDKIMETDKANALKKSQVRLKPKTFMQISDVDTEDAEWFKNWCDKNVSKKQWLGIKALRTIMENLEPLIQNVLVQINSLNVRIDSIEQMIAVLTQPVEEDTEESKTEGAVRRAKEAKAKADKESEEKGKEGNK